MFSSTSAAPGRAKGTPSSSSRAACSDARDDQRGQRLGLGGGASARRRCAPRPCRTTGAGRTDHHTCVYSTIERCARGSRGSRRTPPRRRRRPGTPQRGNASGEGLRCGRSAARSRGRRGTASWPRSPAAAAAPGAGGRTRDRAVGAADADVDVQRERVVAPGDVVQPLLDAAVVLGVDDRAARGSRPTDACRSRRARRRASAASANRRRRWSRWRRERVVQVLAAARADLDLGGDQLAGDRLASTGSCRARRRAAPRSAAPGRASPGSRIANSSSIPTVKSVEASKALAGAVEVESPRRAAQVR